LGGGVELFRGSFFGLGPVFFGLQKVVDTPVSIPELLRLSFDQISGVVGILGGRSLPARFSAAFHQVLMLALSQTTFSTNFYSNVNDNTSLRLTSIFQILFSLLYLWPPMKPPFQGLSMTS
jgi:hypothetical protein